MIEQKKTNVFSKEDFTLYLPLITIISYGLAYVQKIGYYYYWEIPYFFIDLGINALSGTLVTMLPYLITLFLCIYLAKRDQNRQIEQGANYKKKSSKTVIFMYITLFIMYTALNILNGNYNFLPLIIGFLTGSFAFTFIVFISKGKYIKAFMIIIIFSLISAFFVGYNSAWQKTKYVTYKMNDKDFIVVETFNDFYIVTEVDLKSKTYKQEFSLEEMKEIKKVSINRLGKLNSEK